MAEFFEHALGTIGAELSLTGAHAQAGASAQLGEAGDLMVVYELLYIAARYTLTLAHQRLGSHGSMAAERLVAAHFGVWQRRDGSLALTLYVELLAHLVGSHLGHESVGHELAASDGDEARQSVSHLMVQTHDASAYAATRGVVVACHEWPHSGIGSQNSR